MALEPGDERQRRLRLYAVTLAIVGLSALAAVSVLWTAPRIEDGIEDRARARLRLNEVAVDDLLVVANGRNVAVRGPVDDLDEVVRIRLLLEPLYGVRRLDTDGLSVRPRPQADIHLVGQVRAEGISLVGELSRQPQIEQLLVALMPGYGEVSADEIALTEKDALRGDDENRLAGFAALADALSGPDTVEATITLRQGELTAEAIVASSDQRDAVLAAGERFGLVVTVRTLGVDVDQVEADLVMQPDLIVLSGHVLSDGQRLRLIRAAEAVVGPAGVEVDLEVALLPPAFPQPAEQVALAARLVERLGPTDFSEATVRVADGEVTVVVAVNSVDAIDAMLELLGQEPDAVDVVVADRAALSLAAQAALLTAELDEIEGLLNEAEEFSADSDQLLTEARASLRESVSAFAELPDPRVRVVVHTDGRGTSAANLALSQRRAEMVVAYLVTLGVERDRLDAVGAGEAALLVTPEAGDADYARNRRIEFEVITS